MFRLRTTKTSNSFPCHAIFINDGPCQQQKQKQQYSTDSPSMVTLSNKNIFRVMAFCQGNHRSLVASPHRGQWRGTLVFFFICAWTNVGANNGDAIDFRRHCAHYDVTVLHQQPCTDSLSSTTPQKFVITKKKKKQNPTEYVLFMNLKYKSTVILNDARSSTTFLHYWQPVTLGKKPAIALIIMTSDRLSSLDSGTSATAVTNRFGSRICSKPTIAEVKNDICLTGCHNAFYSVKPCKTKNTKPECRRVFLWLILSHIITLRYKAMAAICKRYFQVYFSLKKCCLTPVSWKIVF